MTSTANMLKYFDLHLTGCGYLSRARVVRPKKGHPYWSVTIAACRGEASEKLKTYFDVMVVGEDAFNLIDQHAKAICNKDQSVFVRFKVGDLYPETFVYPETHEKRGQTGVMLKGRLLKLPYMSIDSEVVYREPSKDQVPCDNAESVNTDDAAAQESCDNAESSYTDYAAYAESMSADYAA